MKCLERPLDELDLAVLLLDGASVRDHLFIVAVGIDTQGKKHVLGLVEGPTESAEVCRSLLRDLIGRGLVVERPRLVVLDGGKGLSKAVKTTYGKCSLIQRCRVHKMRNVCEHLPRSRRSWFNQVTGSHRFSTENGTTPQARPPELQIGTYHCQPVTMI